MTELRPIRRFLTDNPAELQRQLAQLEDQMLAVARDLRDSKALRRVTARANYQARDGEWVLGDTTSAAFKVALPAAVQDGRVRVVRSAGSNTLTVVAQSGNISGAASVTVTSSFVEFLSDGSTWYREV